MQRYTNPHDKVERVCVRVTANATPLENGEGYEADTHEFWERADALDLEDVVAQPHAYLNYIPMGCREGAKLQAQGMLNKLRKGDFVVPVPSYREGAAVCNRAEDQSKIAIAYARGKGMAVFELADGEIVSLTHEDIEKIINDGEAAEIRLQQAKQACWAAIDETDNFAAITQILDDFDAVLAEYRPADL